MTVSEAFAQTIFIVSGVSVILAFLSKVTKPIKNQTTKIETNCEEIEKLKSDFEEHSKRLEKDYENINKLKESTTELKESVSELKVDNDKRITIVDEGMKLLLEDSLVGDDKLAKQKVQKKIQEFLLKNI